MPQTLTPAIAASHIHEWLRAWYASAGSEIPDAVDLDVVRQLLPGTPYGQGVAAIKPPQELNLAGCEGSLVRNPNDSTEWGIFYNGKVSFQRQRFTIAHELGHFVLHRNRQQVFRCGSEGIDSGQDTTRLHERLLEREAHAFASDLLMPGDVLRQRIGSQTVNLRLLSALAERFDVSLEALCIRFVQFTDWRAILLYWDNGFLKYEWRSSSAIKTRARIRRNGDPVQPPPGTLAAQASITQERDGIDFSATMWCSQEASHLTVREFKHSYTARDRILTLLLLESAEPRAWDRSWKDEDQVDSFDQFRRK